VFRGGKLVQGGQVRYGCDRNQKLKAMRTITARSRPSAAPQAMIEFNLDGTIIFGEREFPQDAVGYSLDEIKGKHHRMFCEPEYTRSADYSEFWAKLLRWGIFFRGIQASGKRRASEIQIQASYNPIFDADGKVFQDRQVRDRFDPTHQ
jgi:PAS domain-containing protein